MFEKLMIILAFIAVAAGLAYLIVKRNQRPLRAQTSVRPAEPEDRSMTESVTPMSEPEPESEKIPATEGLLFYDQDFGRGGPDGYLAHYQKWCVEVDGTKYHIRCDLTGTPGHPTDGPKKTVAVEPCDGSCVMLVGIPNDVWERASYAITHPPDPPRYNTFGIG